VVRGARMGSVRRGFVGAAMVVVLGLSGCGLLSRSSATSAPSLDGFRCFLAQLSKNVPIWTDETVGS